MIKVSNLTFRYSDDDKLIFDQASLTLESGLWLLEGENGSGKTTLLKLLASKPENRKKLGSIADESVIDVSGEVVLLDNQLVIPGQLSEINFVNYLLSINDVTLKQPYQPRYEKKPLYGYSTGEQKMVIFQLLSYLKPDVLLLDEYISNLDEEHIPEAIAYLESMANKGCLILCSSNELDIRGRFSNKIKIVDRKLEKNVE